MTQTADFDFTDHGSLASLTPLSAAGQTWADEYIESPAWGFGSPTVHIEHRYVNDVLCGILTAGLTICSGDVWIVADADGHLYGAWSLPNQEVTS